MTIAIIGASGSIGSVLVEHLLAKTNFKLVLFSHHAEAIHFTREQERRLTHIDGDVMIKMDIEQAVANCDIAVYLVHLMGQGSYGSYVDMEKKAAKNFAHAVKKKQVQRVIYVGGMGQDDADMTPHLKSRHETGAIIRKVVPQLIELRTPMVIGRGAAGYEIIRLLVNRFPVVPLPTWSRAITQPVTVADVVRYIAAALLLKDKSHITIDIGGPDKLSYFDVARQYAAFKHRRVAILAVPGIPKPLAAWVFRRFKHIPSAITVADMIESAEYSAVIDNNDARQLFPSITPEPIVNAFN